MYFGCDGSRSCESDEDTRHTGSVEDETLPIWNELDELRTESPSLHRLHSPTVLNPFVVFPAEVWGYIIDKMNKSSDLEMLCLALPILEPLVKKSKKNIFLFDKVLPLICKHLDLKDITKSRLVCKKWNRDVSEHQENWNSLNLPPRTSKISFPESDPPIELMRAYRFEDHLKIQKFLQNMTNHPANPFFGRRVHLTVGFETSLKHFWIAALQLVKTFGEHVWNLEIECIRNSRNQVKFYNALQEMLIYLPNLKYITVSCIFTGRPPMQHTLAAQIGNLPIPSLHNLQTLRLALDTGILTAFLPLFCSQIQRLKLFGKTLENPNLKDEYLRGLVNLQTLEVHLKNRATILRLKYIPSGNLKKLVLDSIPGVSFDLEQICNLLRHFSRLESLELGYSCRFAQKDYFRLQLQFPIIKTVQLAVDVHQDDQEFNLDFLLRFPCLEILCIRKKYSGATNLDEENVDKHSSLKVRKFLHTGNMLDLNAWALMTSLKLLEVKSLARSKLYTR